MNCACGCGVARTEVCPTCGGPLCPNCSEQYGKQCRKCARIGAVPQRIKSMRSPVYRATHKAKVKSPSGGYDSAEVTA